MLGHLSHGHIYTQPSVRLQVLGVKLEGVSLVDLVPPNPLTWSNCGNSRGEAGLGVLRIGQVAVPPWSETHLAPDEGLFLALNYVLYWLQCSPKSDGA